MDKYYGICETCDGVFLPLLFTEEQKTELDNEYKKWRIKNNFSRQRINVRIPEFTYKDEDDTTWAYSFTYFLYLKGIISDFFIYDEYVWEEKEPFMMYEKDKHYKFDYDFILHQVVPHEEIIPLPLVEQPKTNIYTVNPATTFFTSGSGKRWNSCSHVDPI